MLLLVRLACGSKVAEAILALGPHTVVFFGVFGVDTPLPWQSLSRYPKIPG